MRCRHLTHAHNQHGSGSEVDTDAGIGVEIKRNGGERDIVSEDSGVEEDERYNVPLFHTTRRQDRTWRMPELVKEGTDLDLSHASAE